MKKSFQELEEKCEGVAQRAIILLALRPTSKYKINKILRENLGLIKGEKSGFKLMLDLQRAGLLRVVETRERGERITKVVETNKELLAEAFAEETGIRKNLILRALNAAGNTLGEAGKEKLTGETLVAILSRMSLSLIMVGLVALYLPHLNAYERVQVKKKLVGYLKKKLKAKELGEFILAAQTVFDAFKT